MGRWGLRQIATLCVLVWILAACGPMLPAPSLEPPATHEATLILRTVSPPATPRTPSAATLAPITPAARIEQTPAPTATPFFYVVTSGDTLESIAARFGISPADLQEANGGLPPDTIHPDQVLLIPHQPPAPRNMSASATTSSTFVRFLPTHTPLPIPLAPPTCYPTPADEILCLGWVANTLESTVTGITIQVSLTGLQGDTPVRRAVSTTQQIIPPGTGVPYVVRFASIPAFRDAEAALLSAEMIPPTTDRDTIALVVQNQAMTQEENLVRVQGKITHEDARSLEDILVVATLFDNAGRVTGFRVLRLEGSLPPGEEMPFEMLITPLAAGTVRHTLHAEGKIVPTDS